MSEVKETRLFLYFIIFGLNVCTIGFTMTNHPPRNWLIGGYSSLGHDAYEVCKHIVGNKPGQYDTIEFCLQDGSELDWGKLQPRILTIIAIGFTATLATLALIRGKEAKAIA